MLCPSRSAARMPARSRMLAVIGDLETEQLDGFVVIPVVSVVKRHLENRGVPYEALDNGILSCTDPRLVQSLCDGLSAEKIDGLLREWLRKLPHPYTPEDRQAGYRYQASILQAEFSLTQVLDRPVTGRVFFEEVIRENLDYKNSRIKQYHKEGRALRTEPTINKHTRLRHWQATEEPAGTVADRLSSQPASA